MGTIVLNEDLSLSYPDDFRELTPEEIGQLNYYKDPPKSCIQDSERHIIIAGSFRKGKGVFGRLADSLDMEEVVEQQTKKAMKSYGYQLADTFSEKIGGWDASGFTYTYQVKDIGMTGCVRTIKRNKTEYYLYCYFRTELQEESQKIIADILDTAKWLQEKDGAVTV